MNEPESWERIGYNREEIGKRVACMFCGEEVEWRDIDPLWITIESAPGAWEHRDVDPITARLPCQMWAHTACLFDRHYAPPEFVKAAMKRLYPPGSHR